MRDIAHLKLNPSASISINCTTMTLFFPLAKIYFWSLKNSHSTCNPKSTKYESISTFFLSVINIFDGSTMSEVNSGINYFQVVNGFFYQKNAFRDH
jgi:hypothetical protein